MFDSVSHSIRSLICSCTMSWSCIMSWSWVFGASSKFSLLASALSILVCEMLSVPTRTSVSFLPKGCFYVGKIGVTILEQVYCVYPRRFCRFFHALFAYKWQAWTWVSYHVIKRYFGTGWVIWDFAGQALQCRWFELCLEIATQYFVWWSRAHVRNHCCCGLWFLYF